MPARRGSSCCPSRRSSRERDRTRPAPARPRRGRGGRSAGPPRQRDALVRRGAVPDPAVREAARATLADVRARGDAAVRDANVRVGGGRRDGRLVLDPADLRGARGCPRPRVRRALDQAIANVRRFAETQRPTSTRTTIVPGVEIERRWTPLARRRRVRPRRLRAVSLVARDDRRPGAGRRGRSGRRRVPGGSRRRQSPGPARCGRPARGRYRHRRGRRPGDRRPRLRPPRCRRRSGRPDRRPRQRLGDRREDRGLRRRRDRPARRPVGGHGPGGATRRRPSRGRGPHHAGRARPRLAGDPRHDRRRRSPTWSRSRSRTCWRRPPGAASSNGRSAEHGGIAIAPTLDAAIAFIDAYAPEHLSVDVEPLEPTVARSAQRRVAVRRAVGAGVRRRLRDGRQPRPADGRPGAWRRSPRGRELRQVHPGAARRPRRARRHPRVDRDARRSRGAPRPPRRRRDPVRADR